MFFYSRLPFALDAFLSHQYHSSLEDEEKSQEFDSFLHLAEVVAGVEPVYRSIHLQFTNVQVDHLTNRNTYGTEYTEWYKQVNQKVFDTTSTTVRFSNSFTNIRRNSCQRFHYISNALQYLVNYN